MDKVVITRRGVQRLFYQAGFQSAPNWSDEKLRRMALQVHRIPESSVPERRRALYQVLLAKAKAQEYIDWNLVKNAS